MKKKIYLGCALTHAPEQFGADVVSFKETLRNEWDVLEFVGLTNGTAQDVYRHDTACVRGCDLFVALCDHPALGLGFELGLAVEIGKPVLAAAKEGVHVTRLVQGVDATGYEFVRYKTLSDLIPRIRARLK